MLRQLLSASAIVTALGVAAPAMAQNYGNNQNWGQQPRYDNNYDRRDDRYDTRTSRQQWGDQGARQRSDQYDRQPSYGGNSQAGSYGDRQDRREDRHRERSDLTLDTEAALQARGYDVGTVDGTLDAQGPCGDQAVRAGRQPAGDRPAEPAAARAHRDEQYPPWRQQHGDQRRTGHRAIVQRSVEPAVSRCRRAAASRLPAALRRPCARTGLPRAAALISLPHRMSAGEAC